MKLLLSPFVGMLMAFLLIIFMFVLVAEIAQITR